MLSPLFHPLQETGWSTGWGFSKTGGLVLGLWSLSPLPTWAALMRSCGRCGLLRLGPGLGALLSRKGCLPAALSLAFAGRDRVGPEPGFSPSWVGRSEIELEKGSASA